MHKSSLHDAPHSGARFAPVNPSDAAERDVCQAHLDSAAQRTGLSADAILAEVARCHPADSTHLTRELIFAAASRLATSPRGDAAWRTALDSAPLAGPVATDPGLFGAGELSAPTGDE